MSKRLKSNAKMLTKLKDRNFKQGNLPKTPFWQILPCIHEPIKDSGSRELNKMIHIFKKKKNKMIQQNV